jgi:hypothetical protein
LQPSAAVPIDESNRPVQHTAVVIANVLSSSSSSHLTTATTTTPNRNVGPDQLNQQSNFQLAASSTLNKLCQALTPQMGAAAGVHLHIPLSSIKPLATHHVLATTTWPRAL